VTSLSKSFNFSNIASGVIWIKSSKRSFIFFKFFSNVFTFSNIFSSILPSSSSFLENRSAFSFAIIFSGSIFCIDKVFLKSSTFSDISSNFSSNILSKAELRFSIWSSTSSTVVSLCSVLSSFKSFFREPILLKSVEHRPPNCCAYRLSFLMASLISSNLEFKSSILSSLSSSLFGGFLEMKSLISFCKANSSFCWDNNCGALSKLSSNSFNLSKISFNNSLFSTSSLFNWSLNFCTNSLFSFRFLT